MRRLIRFLTAIICLPLIYFGAALGGAAIPGARADLPAGTEYLIGLVHGPLHFDLMLPLSPELRARYGFATAAGVPVANPQAEWLLVGWGAAAFYTSTARLADMTLSPVLRGLIGDSAVLHLDVAGDVSRVPDIQYLTLSAAQYEALLARVDASFLRDQTGTPVALPSHLGPHDGFFAASGRFDMFHTCNVWIGEVLRAAGVPFGIWTPTPQAVELALRWHAL